MRTEIHQFVEHASELLGHSGDLLRRVQTIANDGKASGQQFTQSLVRLNMPDSNEVIVQAVAAGRQVVRQAAAAALKIRALIGDRDGILQKHSWTSASPEFTMTELEALLV